tara:strand:- start:249 stop:1550 length:1302 start_codon:yes stop_codon:yes gene_type:complete
MFPRLITINIIEEVFEKKIPLKIIFGGNELAKKMGKDSSLIKEMLFGTFRWYIQLEYILEQLVENPLKKKDRLLKHLMMIGLYQLIYMRIPNHAVVSETVQTCERINMKWAKGLVNAVLRKYIREAKRINLKIDKNETVKFAHPNWLIKKIKTDWPDNWVKILIANNERPPMFLRVNKLRNNRKYYIDQLKKVNIEGVETEHSCHGILLKKPTNVDKLPGFSKGDSSVQDLAAQLAVELLDLKPNQRVLDACAAPGGKTSHILESEPKIESLTAIEKDKLRAKKLYGTLNRIGLYAHVKIEDIINTDKWWDGKKFDRIMLDAPCSATGVIRRHPEIKLLRTMDEIIEVNKLQTKLLTTLWDTLKDDGMLLYVTCSIFNQENRDLIKDFISNHSICYLKPITKKWGVDTGYGRQVLPGQDNMDGFFYACLKKKK